LRRTSTIPTDTKRNVAYRDDVIIMPSAGRAARQPGGGGCPRGEGAQYSRPRGSTRYRGGIHSQEMIEMKWLRSRSPGFLVTFFLYS
jgi:hypothetical protein